MSEEKKDVDDDMEDRDDEEDGEQEAWQTTGKFPKLQMSSDEFQAWCKPYMNSLIVKLLGKTFGVGLMRHRMERMWSQKPIRVTPLNNGYFIVSFSSKEDRDFALQEGPWMIGDHYLLVQRWRPNFNPWKADQQKRIAVWKRIPDLPAELYNVESLRRIGNLVGKTLKIDRTTAFSEKGSFARICVEVDLQRSLLPAFHHFGEDHKILYEGLHLICFQCGKYGHHREHCLLKDEVKGTSEKEAASEEKAEEKQNEGESYTSEIPKAAIPEMEVKNSEIFGPHMIVKREFRRRSTITTIGISQNGKS